MRFSDKVHIIEVEEYDVCDNPSTCVSTSKNYSTAYTSQDYMPSGCDSSANQCQPSTSTSKNYSRGPTSQGYMPCGCDSSTNQCQPSTSTQSSEWGSEPVLMDGSVEEDEVEEVVEEHTYKEKCVFSARQEEARLSVGGVPCVCDSSTKNCDSSTCTASIEDSTEPLVMAPRSGQEKHAEEEDGKNEIEAIAYESVTSAGKQKLEDIEAESACGRRTCENSEEYEANVSVMCAHEEEVEECERESVCQSMKSGHGYEAQERELEGEKNSEECACEGICKTITQGHAHDCKAYKSVICAEEEKVQGDSACRSRSCGASEHYENTEEGEEIAGTDEREHEYKNLNVCVYTPGVEKIIKFIMDTSSSESGGEETELEKDNVISETVLTSSSESEDEKKVLETENVIPDKVPCGKEVNLDKVPCGNEGVPQNTGTQLVPEKYCLISGSAINSNGMRNYKDPFNMEDVLNDLLLIEKDLKKIYVGKGSRGTLKSTFQGIECITNNIAKCTIDDSDSQTFCAQGKGSADVPSDYFGDALKDFPNDQKGCCRKRQSVGEDNRTSPAAKRSRVGLKVSRDQEKEVWIDPEHSK